MEKTNEMLVSYPPLNALKSAAPGFIMSQISTTKRTRLHIDERRFLLPYFLGDKILTKKLSHTTPTIYLRPQDILKIELVLTKLLNGIKAKEARHKACVQMFFQLRHDSFFPMPGQSTHELIEARDRIEAERLQLEAKSWIRQNQQTAANRILNKLIDLEQGKRCGRYAG